MSVQRQSVPSKDADLETTAELPVLDVAAYEAAVTEERSGNTDTWHVPALNAQAAQAAVVSSGTAAVAAAEDRSLQLETDLRSLAENLRDVEERLTRRADSRRASADPFRAAGCDLPPRQQRHCSLQWLPAQPAR